jgi:restriction system protein
MAAWLIRAGRDGERESWCLANGYAGGGFYEVSDLTNATTRDVIRAAVTEAFPGAKPGRTANFAGQLNAMRNRVNAGDLVVLPLKTTGQIALGTVTSGYEYLEGEADPDRRHVVRVDWRRTDASRAAVRQDLLHSLGAFITVCEVSRNDGAWRLQRVLSTGADPGARPTTVKDQGHDVAKDEIPSDEYVESIDYAQAAWDRIRIFVGERYAGHGLARLVGAVLTAQGYLCEVSPQGPDGGVDLVAGRGPLGLDSPRVVVQVKSQTNQVGIEVINQLIGVRAHLQADQALLVAWGGITKPARAQADAQRFTLKVWDAEAFLSALLQAYPLLSEEMRAELPLKQTWVLVEASDGSPMN